MHNGSRMQNRKLDRHFKEQFIYGSSDDGMITQTLQDLTTISDTSSIASKQVIS